MPAEVSPAATVTLDGSGNGQVSLTPPPGTVWRLRLATVSTTGTVKQPQCFLYRGSTSGPQQLIDSTYLGNSASSGKVAGAPFFAGQVLWARWAGGDAGAVATLQAYGQQGTRGEQFPFDLAPVGEGFPLNVASTFQAGNTTVINSSGMFIYNGAPGPGTLAASIAPAAGTDPYGNGYGAGFESYGALGAAAQITSASIGLFSGLNAISVINLSGYFLYSPSGGAGNLVASITPAAGTDSYGNAYLAGVTVYGQQSPGNWVAVQLATGVVNWYGASSEAGPWSLGFDIVALSSGGLVAWQLQDHVNNLMFQTSQVTFGGVNRGVCSFTPNPAGGTVQPVIMAGDPVIGGSALETWHDMRPLSNSFVGTIAGQYPPQYRRTPEGFVEIFGFIQTPAAGNPNSVTFATLPAAYRPGSNAGPRWPVTLATNVTPVGTPACQIDTGGNLQLHFLPSTATSNVVCISGRYPLDLTGVITS